MNLFNLPDSTIVNKVVPKNAFDRYTNTKQKKLFTNQVAKILWINKLSQETINLPSGDIKEIQLFHIELKQRNKIPVVLQVIERAVPYHIIFIVEYERNFYLSTSAKHPNPVNEDNAVIDWTFDTDWIAPSENIYSLNLKKSLDAIYHDFCIQLSGNPLFAKRPFKELVEESIALDSLKKEAEKLKSAIATTKQFNQKVALNIRLKTIENQLGEAGGFLKNSK